MDANTLPWAQSLIDKFDGFERRTLEQLASLSNVIPEHTQRIIALETAHDDLTSSHCELSQIHRDTVDYAQAYSHNMHERLRNVELRVESVLKNVVLQAVPRDFTAMYGRSATLAQFNIGEVAQ
jgi:hypothetical protein